MHKLFTIIIIVFGLFLTNCGKKAEEVKNAMEVLNKMPEAANQMQKSADKAQARIEARKKSGDTLAVPYKKLQEFLPQSIEGYTTAEPSGESMNMGGFSYSQAKRTYSTPDGQSIEITLMDYNENYGMYAGLSFWAAGFSQENDESMEKTFNTGIDDTYAVEKYYKKGTNDAELTYALGYRFILTIHASKQKSTDFAKSIAQKMDLNKISKM